jgi:hypothetical protein
VATPGRDYPAKQFQAIALSGGKEDVMDRRDFCKGILLYSSLNLAGPALAAQTQQRVHTKVIDAHCHAGKGLNYDRDDSTSDPWTTYNDPKWTLRKADEVGIDQTIIFPISNTTYKEANED